MAQEAGFPTITVDDWRYMALHSTVRHGYYAGAYCIALQHSELKQLAQIIMLSNTQYSIPVCPFSQSCQYARTPRFIPVLAHFLPIDLNTKAL